MQPESFKKGDLFEKFVETELFKATVYVLVSRTNNYDQNKVRYAEDTLRPDFKFRCKKTEQEFYVEAKYRSRFKADKKIEVISYGQIERFKVFQKEENIPIFIAIGYGGVPDNPKNVSLIPLDQLSYLELYPTFLKRFNINKGLIASNTLNLQMKQTEEESEKPLENEPAKQETPAKETSITFFKNKKVLAASGIGMILLAFLLFNAYNTSIEETLKQKTTEYYSTLHSGNIDALENFINPRVDKWYSQSELTLEEIKEDTKRYIKKYPATSTAIQWDTFTVTPLNDSYSVTYNMIYKLLKENKGKDIIYHLKIHAVWDKDLKIKSLYEEKI
ncbi:hypothetical protein [Aequorivita sp. CIP111184]|uniref:hypothetical protein n=1 Tax=Aequorivita sp. CIP111184 TaxID=2211356 RepID=UPI000DBBBD14|nr:hypothetical protein [Aequorivita sp. CIP111184]SRX56131.1 hypothetical protein AEQU1_03158 [Aequorivita sp. CIP111184]